MEERDTTHLDGDEAEDIRERDWDRETKTGAEAVREEAETRIEGENLLESDEDFLRDEYGGRPA